MKSSFPAPVRCTLAADGKKHENHQTRSGFAGLNLPFARHHKLGRGLANLWARPATLGLGRRGGFAERQQCCRSETALENSDQERGALFSGADGSRGGGGGHHAHGHPQPGLRGGKLRQHQRHRRQTGELVWSQTFDSHVLPKDEGMWLCPNNLNATPTIDKARGLIYVIAADGKFYGLDLGTGADALRPRAVCSRPTRKDWSLNLSNDIVYTSSPQGCGGARSESTRWTSAIPTGRSFMICWWKPRKWSGNLGPRRSGHRRGRAHLRFHGRWQL